jgi:hypothetical protein
MNTITCTTCGTVIEIDKALEGQIEARVLAAERARHEADLISVRKEAEASAQKKAEIVSEARIQQLKEDADAEKEANRQLRAQLGELMTSLREEKTARANAELDAQRKLAAEEGKIREEALRQADETYKLRLAEQEKKLSDTQNALEDARRKANQGSQQNQGEVLELDLENRLREEFPFDEILEVKKGQRGADVRQVVHDQSGNTCGTLLWETKNGTWQPAWIPKFKADIREANANVGILVSQQIPAEIGEMKHLEANVWVVSPRLAPRLAAAVRATILQVDAANKMSAGKDAKMESLYQFLVGPEFRHRVEAIVENYTLLQDEIEKEKRSTALKWARQEKAIRAVIDNTIGMYGDFQGITARALPAIRSLALEEGDEA